MKYLVAVFVFFCSCAWQQPALPSPSEVRVVTESGDGCAVMTEAGLVTARHVVDGAVWPRADFSSRATALEIEELPAGTDVAWLMPHHKLEMPALVAGDFVKVGQPVAVLGCRSGERAAVVLGVKGGLVALSGVPRPGDSGSAVVDQQHHLVGIVVARGKHVTWAESLVR